MQTPSAGPRQKKARGKVGWELMLDAGDGKSGSKKGPLGQREPFRVLSGAHRRRLKQLILLGRSRRESFSALRGFWFWLRLGSLLDFFSAFIFASHDCKCATKTRFEESL
jgi:hypothetical protein